MAMREDRERQARVLDAMLGAALDAVICGSPSEVLLLTGYWPVMGGSVAIVTGAGERCIVLPADEMSLAEKMTSAVLVPYKPAQKDRLLSPMEALAAPLASTLQRLGLAQATVGLSIGRGMQPASYAVMVEFRASLAEAVRQMQPNACYVACDAMLEHLQGVKTARELEQLRKAANVASDGFAAVDKALEPGLREAEVAARVQAAFASSPRGEEFERSYGSFFCMSGPNAALASAAYARTRQRRLEEGDLVIIHANTCGDGLWTDLTRTYTVGPPAARHREMRAAIDEARSAALAAIHPGIRASEVDRAARTVMERHGFGEAFKHATGHGVGFAAANPDALPRIHPQSPDILEEGMTFNIEPAAYFDGYGGMRHCDVVSVTNSGADVLSRW